jgi:hypothetical protein
VLINDVFKFFLEREIKSISQTPPLQLEGTQATPVSTNIVLPFENKEISIPLIVCRAKIKLSTNLYSSVGKRMKKLWEERHNKSSEDSPPKGKQWVHGKVLNVSTYYEEDADLMERAIREVMEKHALKEKRKK